MEIKVLCDRCFKNVMEDEVLYKYGSVVYCKECHEKIEIEILSELAEEYLKTTDNQKEKELEFELINYQFLRKEA